MRPVALVHRQLWRQQTRPEKIQAVRILLLHPEPVRRCSIEAIRMPAKGKHNITCRRTTTRLPRPLLKEWPIAHEPYDPVQRGLGGGILGTASGAAIRAAAGGRSGAAIGGATEIVRGVANTLAATGHLFRLPGLSVRRENSLDTLRRAIPLRG